MKKNVFNRTFAASLLSILMVSGWSGCMKNETEGPSGSGNGALPVFDFSTKSAFTLSVNYAVPQGYQVYFEVYTENPFETVDGQQVKKTGLEPIDKGYTDASGKYANKITIPSYVQTLYIYSPDAGVTELLTAEVQNGTLSNAALPSRPANRSVNAVTRAMTLYNTVDIPGITTKVFGLWQHWGDGYAKIPGIDPNELYFGEAKLWGRPEYLTYVDQNSFSGGSPALMVSADIWRSINSALPGRDVPQKDVDKILDNGDIHVTETAELDIYILDERGLYNNTLAYYCYPTGNPPASASDIRFQTVVFPNAKIIRSHDSAIPGSGTVYDYGALRPGEGVRLRYIDEAGVDQGTTFPAGVSVGWVLYADGYKDGYRDPVTGGVPGTVTKGYGAIYSDQSLMGGMAHVALFRHGDFVVTSFEDGAKTTVNDARDYDDVMFHVASTPSSAIIPGVPDVDPNPPQEIEVTYRGILLFEDNWPYRGDFDMNDVVVKYVSTVTYNAQNQVTKTVDNYTVLWVGAKFSNGFACQNPNLTSGDQVSFSGAGTPARDAADQSVIRLVSLTDQYGKQDDTKTITVTTKYGTPVAKANFTVPPYNPFIAPDKKDNTVYEVHLTNHKPTSFMDAKWLGYGHDKSDPSKGYYYVTYDESDRQMPFAIDIAFGNDEEMAGFVIPEEMKCINEYYSGFMKWIQSKGETDKDWYLYPNK